MTKLEKAIREKVDQVFPAGATLGVMEFLTGQGSNGDAYKLIQRMAIDAGNERRGLDARLDDLRRHEGEAERVFADARNWLARSHAGTSDDKLLGQYLMRELAFKRRMSDIEAEREGVFARLAELDQAKPALELLLRLAHVRAGQVEADSTLAGEFGLTFEELVTPAEIGKIERRRKEERERQEEEARRIEAERERKAGIYAQIEREKSQRAARDAAEVELVESMTIPQMLNLLFEESQPPKDLMAVCFGQFNEGIQRRALQDLAERQSWPSYTPAKIRAAARLHELVAGAKYGLELRA